MKRHLITTTAIGLTCVVATLTFLTSTTVTSEENEGKAGWFDLNELRYPEVEAITNPLYIKECGSCHMAYPPGLLPEKSWQHIMNNLQDHFSDNAELSPEIQSSLTEYLTAHAADHSQYRRSRNIMQSLEAGSDIGRITQTPFFKSKHAEIPQKFVKDNPKVGSFSQCQLCHQNAQKGSFNEDEISIPGVGYWED